MESNSRIIVSFILVVALCTANLITPTIAQSQTQTQTQTQLPSPIDIQKCWSSLFNVNGCVLELFNSVFSGQYLGNIGPACCKAFSAIDTNCWPHMFPLNPFFPPLIKDNCAHIVPGSPPVRK